MQLAIPRPGGSPGEISAQLAQRATRVFPGGITRNTVDRDPGLYYIGWGQGAHLHDVDGRQFLDLNNNFTTLIHGHGFEPVVDAVTRTLRDGTCYSNPTVHEIALAELLCDRVPAVEQVRFVNTGTEAVMFAIKAARALTSRPGVAKIEGAYHGAYDWAEVGQMGSPITWGPPDNPCPVPAYNGQPSVVLDDVVVLRFNDIEAAVSRIKANASRLACILIDPMPSRAGLMAPDPAFLEAVTRVARENGILIVADEVLNLRQGYEGASARFGLDPDLVAMGKIIGGGFPIGAIGGKRGSMAVFGTALLSQGGTFSANPVSMVAGLEAMRAMTRDNFNRLETLGEGLRARLQASIKNAGAPFSVSGSASLFRIHPKTAAPSEYREAFLSSQENRAMTRLDYFMKDHGVLMPKGAASSLSTAMNTSDVDLVADTFEKFLDTQDFQHDE
ncbi:Glutamate-1-semialdehyde aminotransferase 2 (plasmid) [Neorhizobium galegae bv. officinalis bv. officinalis str. HAMBI 1141]|uniref:Glutamate-1-semialdehyde aminotransferase 2 n=1 Tax=Neorhizobium galegae bv. officinalis bv. officinalis str. HAMBI 1141 TaxID=1028801 RepID=A0A068TK45_NEOGA|nr:aspartate aminotransferase family protein [Neorhizobium galegae]CDN57673.1 Glutamate-1-semialdehyde aminotransferase 2 [Neorhizobium galegae bv. officinalis bv. officinalis str. HAMBI 1141]CDN58466.1 Glutamate-1-semialdehyde aminotransferase 2 [Neorhizobium galegae bv. officinalis bv. officinalis str. HAMBI 1141]